MKSSILLLSFTLFVFAPIAKGDWVEDAVNQIRSDYNATEGASLKSQTIKLDDGPEFAELKKYYKDGTLVKMAYTSGGDHGGATDYYYFKNGQLYFVYQKQSFWSFDPAGGEGATKGTGREQRIYFKDNKVIRHLVKEASHSDESAINRLLAKAPNQPVNDPEAAVGLGNAGYRLLNVTNQQQLESFLYQE